MIEENGVYKRKYPCQRQLIFGQPCFFGNGFALHHSSLKDSSSNNKSINIFSMADPSF
jgi:hypothetical protein